MTAGARDRGMRAAQREIRELMVELGRVERHDVGGATQVLRVTGVALGSGHGGSVSVQSPPVADIRRDPFVAIQAERGLAAAVADVVADRAVLLELAVRVGELARHEQGLRIDRLDPARMQGEAEKQKEEE